ncbi:MAG: hypothetical protein MI743_09180, partial [Sneathiellales bacterium]|nr:hypothetical protein [Sneathiellales bacterium]
MSKPLSVFSPVPGVSGLWSAQKGGLRCTALKLRDGTLCLYSPVLGLTDTARESLQALGDVAFLLAPNHYHNKGVAEYAGAYPKAQLVCTDKARSRLEKQTGHKFQGLDRLQALLPDNCTLVEPEGLKTGEIWFELASEATRAWVVTDTFKGPTGPVGTVSERIELLGTFPKFGIQDKMSYMSWLE